VDISFILHITILQGDYGDVTDRKSLRSDLKCKTFSWYLKEVYPELFIPGEAIASGEVTTNITFYMLRKFY
jgi:hypothetical protein